MKKVYVFLAEGFEEIEAVTPIDLLRRAGIECMTVSVMDTLQVKGARGITVCADMLFNKEICADGDGVVLPGGMPGTTNLAKHPELLALLREYNKKKKTIGAICAAPMVLGMLGIVEGKKATIYPGMENELKGAVCCDDEVCHDGHVITSKGVGTAIPFALKLVEQLTDQKTALDVKESIVFKH